MYTCISFLYGWALALVIWGAIEMNEQDPYRWKDLQYKDRGHWRLTLVSWAVAVVLMFALAWLAHRRLP
jgi:hypothetical protein